MRNPKTSKKQIHLPTLAKIERLLARQTKVILDAVDSRLAAQSKEMEFRFSIQDQRLSKIETRIERLEERLTGKFNELTTTLDKFLKRMTDMEDEFTFIKEDLKRVKAVLRDKLGVSLE